MSYRSWLRSLLVCSCDVIRTPITSFIYVEFLNIVFNQKKKKKKKKERKRKSLQIRFLLFSTINLRCGLHGMYCISEEWHKPPCATHIASPVQSTATSYWVLLNADQHRVSDIDGAHEARRGTKTNKQKETTLRPCAVGRSQGYRSLSGEIKCLVSLDNRVHRSCIVPGS